MSTAWVMLRGIGRFDEKHSREQREAVIHHQLEGNSAPETVRAAAAGELGLPPFNISETTCRDLARERRGQHSSPDPPAEQHEAEERAWLEQQVARVKALENPSSKDIHTMQQALRALDDIEKRAARKRPAQPEPDPDAPPSELVLELWEKMQAERAELQARSTGGKCPCDPPIVKSGSNPYGALQEGACVRCGLERPGKPEGGAKETQKTLLSAIEDAARRRERDAGADVTRVSPA